MNFNVIVSVKLTKEGYDHLWKKFEAYDIPGYPAQKLMESYIEDGRLFTPLWQLMSWFGSEVHMGAPNMFECNEFEFKDSCEFVSVD